MRQDENKTYCFDLSCFGLELICNTQSIRTLIWLFGVVIAKYFLFFLQVQTYQEEVQLGEAFDFAPMSQVTQDDEK